MDHVQAQLRKLNNYYESLDRIHLERRFAELAKRTLHKSKAEDFWQDLQKVYTLHDPDTGHGYFIMPTENRIYPAGTIFWRGREAKGDLSTGQRRIQSPQDLWARPYGTNGSLGRLNKADEPLLYTCVQTPYAVPDELQLSEGEDLYLIKYRATQDISVNWIGGPINVEGLSKRAARNAQLIQDALAHFFSRPVQSSCDVQPIYGLSELIAKDLFDLPGEIQDGWIFPSTHDRNSVNAVFRPDKSRALLEVVGACLCTVHTADQRKLFQGHSFTDGTIEDNLFQWETLGSQVQKRSFPEFG